MMTAPDLFPVNISISAAQNKPPLFTTCFRAKTSNVCCWGVNPLNFELWQILCISNYLPANELKRLDCCTSHINHSFPWFISRLYTSTCLFLVLSSLIGLSWTMEVMYCSHLIGQRAAINMFNAFYCMNVALMLLFGWWKNLHCVQETFHVRSCDWSSCKKPFMMVFSIIISSWSVCNSSKTSSSTHKEASDMSGALLWKRMERMRTKPLCVRNSFNEVKINTDPCLSSPDEKKPSLFYRPYTALTLGRQPFWTGSQQQAIAQFPLNTSIDTTTFRHNIAASLKLKFYLKA